MSAEKSQDTRKSWLAGATITQNDDGKGSPQKYYELVHLSDVDDLGGSVPDAVDAQQLQGLRVENELEEPVRPPEHLALRELLVVREADLRYVEAAPVDSQPVRT